MGEPDILYVMILIGIGVPAFALLVLAAWSSNVLSLYSGSLAMATIFRGTRSRPSSRPSESSAPHWH